VGVTRLRRFGLWCGIISPILWLALLAIAGAMRTDFSHVTNYISELGARGSATEAMVRYGAFVFTGVLYICFAAALPAAVRAGGLGVAVASLIAIEGFGRMGAGVFPCDPGCVQRSPGPNLHTLFATIGFCAGILAAILGGMLARRVPHLRPLSSLSVACGAVAFASLALMTWGDVAALPAGLLEHLATVVLSVWLLLFAGRLRLARSEAGTSRPPVRT